MVVCKYFQQGNCRFGQYCRFDHINNYGTNTAARGKTHVDGKSIALGVAEEVLAAERGGQWLLSCFGPFKEQPSIAGMEDLSPDEVRWEMYQAQQNGTTDQMKLQFQQLCQEMKVKRDALKNPTPEIVSMLEKLQKGNQGGFGSAANSAAKPNNFSFASPQLGLANNATPAGTPATSNPFGSKFGNNANPFANSYAPAAAPQGTSIFGRSGNTNPAFSAKPTFGSAPVFGSSVFGKFTPQNSVFGGTAATNSTTPVFGQTQVQPNSFLRPQSQPTNSNVFGTTTNSNVFSGATSTSGSIFGGSTLIQTSSSSMFAAKPATNSIFGGATTTFGAAPAPAAFGSAPVFGATPTFAKPFSALPPPPPTTANPMFGGSATFGATAFGTPQAFSAVGPPTTSAPIFANATPFGTISKAPSFAEANTFGNFGVNSTNAPDSGTNLAASLPANSPFLANSNLSMNPANSPFAPNYTASQNSIVNPFGQRIQTASSLFSQNPFTPAASQSPFSKPFSSVSASIIDDSVYSDDNQLTDDEKLFYMAEQFEFGRIPLKPPTKDLR